MIVLDGFSALQRAEIAEIYQQSQHLLLLFLYGFSALQRAEIAEISAAWISSRLRSTVSVLFNEPKLLKYIALLRSAMTERGFSALQRAEIAEIPKTRRG